MQDKENIEIEEEAQKVQFFRCENILTLTELVRSSWGYLLLRRYCYSTFRCNGLH